MKHIKKLLAVILAVVLLVPTVSLFSYGVSDTEKKYDLSQFPKINLNGHTDFVIYKEGWRNDRIELALFNTKNDSDKLIVKTNWTLGYEDTSNYLDDEKYYIENGQWKIFETGSSYVTNHCTEVLLSSRDIYDTNGNIVLNGQPSTLEFNGHYYKFFSNKMKWHDAKAYCESIGGHLVTISSMEENDFVVSICTELIQLGLTDEEVEGEWKWVTGEPYTFSNFDPGEPNNQGDEDYAYISNLGHGRWGDGHLARENWAFVCEWDSAAELSGTPESPSPVYGSLEQYMADIILNRSNYTGVLKNMDGSTPQNYLYNYALQPQQISLSRIYVDLLHQNADFMVSAAGWETLTFSPSDTYQNALDEIGYYEVVIMNVLDCAVKYTILPSAVKDTQKTVSSITSPVLKALQRGADKNYETLLNQPWGYFSEAKQLEIIEEAGKKCVNLKSISGYASSISDIFSTAADLRAALEKIASLEKIAEIDTYVVSVLDAMYKQCPASNTAMKTAIAEVQSVCKSGFDKAMVELLNGAASVANVVVSEGINDLWKGAISAAGGGVGVWVLVAQMTGKALSNFMFSTDACLEQFYMMEALVNVEDTLIKTVKDLAWRHTNPLLSTAGSAKRFLTAEKMLLGLYDLSADYARDFTEIIKTKGAVNGIKSIFGFGNVQEFAEYCNTATAMKNNISTFKLALFDFDFGYKTALQIDDPIAYSAYLSGLSSTSAYWNASVMTVACPTDVEIYDEYGQLVARVTNNQLVGLVPGIAVWIDGDVKHFVLPKDSAYQIQITGTDAGTMDYTVSEYADGVYAREIVHSQVPLTAGCIYDTDIPNTDGIETDTYLLTDENGNTLSPTIDSQFLKIAGASLTLQSDLTLNYKVSKSLFADGAYQNPYILFEMNGIQTKVDNYIEDDTYYVFQYKSIAPNQLNDTVKATLCATADGSVLRGVTVSYSVAKYCYNMLNYCTTDSYAKLRTLLVDLLNYGTQSQLYTNYQTDSLANAALTEEQKAYGTAEPPTLTSCLNTVYAPIESPSVLWQGAGLRLEKAVAMRFLFTTEDVTNLTVKFKIADGEWEIPASEFEKQSEMTYCVYFNGLHAGQLREPIFVTAYRNGTAVSNTVCYSVESYAFAKQDSTIPCLATLVQAMMQYGDSASAYAQ